MPADSHLRPLSEKILEAMERLYVPGVAVGVLHEGVEHVAGFGVTNVYHPLPVDADTLFQIGSTTKTVTGTAVMLLVEMGKLDLDAPVRTYLPDLRLSSADVAAAVTMRHLLPAGRFPPRRTSCATHASTWATGPHRTAAGSCHPSPWR